MPGRLDPQWVKGTNITVGDVVRIRGLLWMIFVIRPGEDEFGREIRIGRAYSTGDKEYERVFDDGAIAQREVVLNDDTIWVQYPSGFTRPNEPQWW